MGSKYIEVEFDLAEFDDDELMAELEHRKKEIPGIQRATLERLYYATRHGNAIGEREIAEIHEVLASLYGRAT